ncbi:MAG: GMC family oxidoreductase [Pseudomonadota bacterium]
MSDLLDQPWDFIVIGTGMGGGTIGRVLAEAGLRVLFVEKGPAGYRAEQQAIHSEVFLPEARLARGFWPEPMRATIGGVTQDFFAPIGAGVGGSSAFYAATLERPEPHDLSADWPISYAAMRDAYAKAEEMFAVCGEPDPLSDEVETLRSPPPLAATDAALIAELRASGLNPYRLHAALKYLPGCADCLGRKCPRACKMDGRSAGVEPALATGHAALIDMCDVTRLHSDGRRITGLTVARGGALRHVKANRVILAGGALGSAHLMLASASETAPSGIANASGLVGRNLMFHLNEMFALWPRTRQIDPAPSKAISLRDLYHMDNQRFGTVQSLGVDAGYGEILHYLRLMLGRSRLRHIPGAHDLARIPAALAERFMGQAKIFVGLLEDIGYPENRVLYDAQRPGALTVEYRIKDELIVRRRAFRKALRKALPRHRKMFLSMAPELNFGHPCGTARMGLDPAKSVLRPDCRAHELTNLWVVDSSFMPSSFGVNPSLTIAANALRVGEILIKEMRR